MVAFGRLPSELIDAILCEAGPIALAHHRDHVAAVRIQRCWRRMRALHDGDWVLFRYRWMRHWEKARVWTDGVGGFVLRGAMRVVFDAHRRRRWLYIIPYEA